jgi:hypothetical protein
MIQPFLQLIRRLNKDFSVCMHFILYSTKTLFAEGIYLLQAFTSHSNLEIDNTKHANRFHLINSNIRHAGT